MNIAKNIKNLITFFSKHKSMYLRLKYENFNTTFANKKSNTSKYLQIEDNSTYICEMERVQSHIRVMPSQKGIPT